MRMRLFGCVRWCMGGATIAFWWVYLQYIDFSAVLVPQTQTVAMCVVAP